VTFRFKNRRHGAERYGTTILEADEFIRQLLLHVLPREFHRIRHYGLLASAGRRDNLRVPANCLHCLLRIPLIVISHSGRS
jgi:hypothetical protein